MGFSASLVHHCTKYQGGFIGWDDVVKCFGIVVLIQLSHRFCWRRCRNETSSSLLCSLFIVIVVMQPVVVVVVVVSSFCRRSCCVTSSSLLLSSSLRDFALAYRSIVIIIILFVGLPYYCLRNTPFHRCCLRRLPLFCNVAVLLALLVHHCSSIVKGGLLIWMMWEMEIWSDASCYSMF